MLCAYDQACLACVNAEGLAGLLRRQLACCRISSLVDGATTIPAVGRIVGVPERVIYRSDDAVPGLVLGAGASVYHI